MMPLCLLLNRLLPLREREMTEFVAVYNPADHKLEFRFNSQIIELKADGITILPRKIGAHGVEQFKKLGVSFVRAGATEPELKQAMLVAKAHWVELERGWAEQVLIGAHARNEQRKALGLDPDPTPSEVKARAFLIKHGFLKETN